MKNNNKLALFYVAPSFLIIISVIFYPFLYNIIISISNMNLGHFKNWTIIGFDHYLNIFQDSKLLIIFLKTLIWTAINLFFHVTLGVMLALILNRPIPGKSIFRIILILPWAIPQYIVALTFRGLFNYDFGAFNLLLKVINISPVNWLSDPTMAYSAAIITNVWLGFPFMMIIALGGLQSIPQELYEAAEIDGASLFSQFWNITVPLLKPVMIPAISLGMIWTFNNFNVIWLVSNGGEPSDNTHILVSYVYKAVFTFYRYGYAAALSLVIFIILLIFSTQFLRKTKVTESVY